MKNIKKVVSLIMVVIFTMSVIGIAVNKLDVYASEGEQLMFRIYNPNSGEHFYTSSEDERDELIHQNWEYEGVGFIAPLTGNPVYRMYNSNVGDHHYTLSENEKNMLIKAGWDYEGIGWYSDDGGEVAMYRLYNPNATSGSHHYTVSNEEKECLLKLGWKDEGLSWVSMHNIVTDDTYREANCVSDGFSGGVVCINCGKKYDCGIVLYQNWNNHDREHSVYHNDEIKEYYPEVDEYCRNCNEVVFHHDQTNVGISNVHIPSIVDHLNARHNADLSTPYNDWFIGPGHVNYSAETQEMLDRFEFLYHMIFEEIVTEKEKVIGYRSYWVCERCGLTYDSNETYFDM